MFQAWNKVKVTFEVSFQALCSLLAHFSFFLNVCSAAVSAHLRASGAFCTWVCCKVFPSPSLPPSRLPPGTPPPPRAKFLNRASPAPRSCAGRTPFRALVCGSILGEETQELDGKGGSGSREAVPARRVPAPPGPPLFPGPGAAAAVGLRFRGRDYAAGAAAATRASGPLEPAPRAWPSLLTFKSWAQQLHSPGGEKAHTTRD